MNKKEKNRQKNCKKPIVVFWNKNRKKIFVVTSVIGVAVLTALGIKNYWDSTEFKRFPNNASLGELKSLRDNVQDEYLKHTVNDEYRLKLWNLLSVLNEKIGKLEWAGKTPTAPTYSREDGRNLYRRD